MRLTLAGWKGWAPPQAPPRPKRGAYMPPGTVAPRCRAPTMSNCAERAASCTSPQQIQRRWPTTSGWVSARASSVRPINRRMRGWLSLRRLPLHPARRWRSCCACRSSPSAAALSGSTRRRTRFTAVCQRRRATRGRRRGEQRAVRAHASGGATGLQRPVHALPRSAERAHSRTDSWRNADARGNDGKPLHSPSGRG